MENAANVDEFMRDKYTNRELYDWMVGQLSAVYFQSYRLALRRPQARRAGVPPRARACTTRTSSSSATGTA